MLAFLALLACHEATHPCVEDQWVFEDMEPDAPEGFSLLAAQENWIERAQKGGMSAEAARQKANTAEMKHYFRWELGAERRRYRERAITAKAALVSGLLMFWLGVRHGRQPTKKGRVTTP
jgi:hypothetical protein